MTRSPTRAMTVAHAMLQILMLTPPYGQRGNPRIHSTYQGNQPLGNRNIGFFPCQNCRKKRSPLVANHRSADAFVSNDPLEADTIAAVILRIVSTFLPHIGSDSSLLFSSHIVYSHTCLVVLSQNLVMLTPDFGPSCEIILRRNCVHLPLQPHHLSP